MIQSGKLRHVVTIEKPVNAKGAMGGSATTWVPHAEKVRMDITPVSGRERLASDKIDAEIDARARLRYIAGVTEDMRVNHNGEIWNIRAAINVRKLNRELQLLLSTGLNDG